MPSTMVRLCYLLERGITMSTCKSLENSYNEYARQMAGGTQRYSAWEYIPFGAFDDILSFFGEQAPEGCRPVTPLFEMPPGYSMYEWDADSGKVVGKSIIVTSNVKLRPYIEAHELGHAWNAYEAGFAKSVDELQACLRGARYIPVSKKDVYWDIMWQYLRTLGVQLTWDGYIFSYPPCQLNAIKFAWSIANGYFKLATPLAIPLDQ